MRGEDVRQNVLFSYRSVEDRIPADHPLRAMQALVEPALAALSPRFQAIYATIGRPSIPPEQLLRALLLQIRYTIRSERQLMEQLDYNLLFRWCVGLTPDEPVWVPTTFTHNRDRFLTGTIADAFAQEVLKAADARQLLSHEHFTLDGTLLEGWASQKSFRRKDDPSPPPPDGDAGIAARRCTMVVDAGQPRNRQSPAAHGVFTRDGVAPAELLRLGAPTSPPIRRWRFARPPRSWRGARPTRSRFDLRARFGSSLAMGTARSMSRRGGSHRRRGTAVRAGVPNRDLLDRGMTAGNTGHLLLGRHPPASG